MTHQEKERVCQLLASLFSPPDREWVKEGAGRLLPTFFQKYILSWGGKNGLLAGLILEGEADLLMREMKNEYDRLFSKGYGESVSLVESCYKPWTHIPGCSLPFASEQGLLMGDSAFHLLDIYHQFGLEVADEFKAIPDHLVMELEFLSYLYRWGTEADIRMFITDHLDWIPLLKEELKKVHPHPFYRSLFEVLDLFLNTERIRLEIGDHGEKSIH